nr:hypothetical protein BaRGS_017133 [Batillaria attramentaria]
MARGESGHLLHILGIQDEQLMRVLLALLSGVSKSVRADEDLFDLIMNKLRDTLQQTVEDVLEEDSAVALCMVLYFACLEDDMLLKMKMLEQNYEFTFSLK